MKGLARWIFRSLAKKVLARHHPIVVAVAGSIGKTAVKDGIAAGLSKAKHVRKNFGNFNAEVGVPVTIIAGGKAPSGAGWFAVPFRGLQAWLGKQPYPEVLVLELGTDKPGDLEPLLQLTNPTVSVLTAIAPEHLEFFGDLDAVAQEEASVLRQLRPDGIGIVNADDPLARGRSEGLSQRMIRYGWDASADIQAQQQDVSRDMQGRATGQVIKVAIDGHVVPIGQPGILGKHQAYPVLAALSVGTALDIPIAKILEGLTTYTPPPGRMRLLEGVQGAILIDDSYNASPQAMVAALDTLAELEVPGKRIAILGQMSELGTASLNWHTWVGEKITRKRCDLLITVGPLAERIGQAAIAKGFPKDRVRNVSTAEAAAAEIRTDLTVNDVVLLKGSRFAARLERAVKLLLNHPERDAHLLVGGH